MTLEGAQTAPGVVEDVFEGHATGVEVEDTGDDQVLIKRPWRPEQIRVSTSAFSLRNILDLIEEESLELAPDFQRGQVWGASQKSLLVESLLLQIPLPAFYFAEHGDGSFSVVDGLQRLSTLYAFVRGEGEEDGFALTKLEHLEELKGLRFNDLPVPFRRRINNTQLTVNVIDPSTPRDVTYEIFKRINTGGTPLNAQEIRHCMSRPRSREILKRMTHTEAFDTATGRRLRNHIRMNDREMALRFAGFWLQGLDAYYEKPAMEPFLWKTTEMLDSPERVPDTRVAELEAAFESAMHNAHLLFGEHAFRKWPHDYEYRSPINRALFETWSIALAGYDSADLFPRRGAIVESARRRMTNDVMYLNAITSSTADRRRVDYRFTAAAKDVEAGR
ncbi:GmrSD restriction endonuclease domain-containing protein [Streptomyces uncialis]|uniref:GmrSD restriction endonuclease domain-containing protein n=1 Tax=Streptomyces uncialis TaxID=1048205 RepID=UPI0033FEE341